MAKNEFNITILENGVTRIDSDSFDGPSHQIAEKALFWITRELGGEVTRTRKNHTHSHIHSHDHEHNHSH